MKRLKQIERQVASIGIFQDKDVQETLKLSDKQKDQIKEINTDLEKEMADLRGGGFNPENIAKMQTLRKDSLANAMKVLDDKQKKEIKELIGKPFELKPEISSAAAAASRGKPPPTSNRSPRPSTSPRAGKDRPPAAAGWSSSRSSLPPPPPALHSMRLRLAHRKRR